MFVVCKACAGDGEGVYGHSWTTCPVCNGAGQVVDLRHCAPAVPSKMKSVPKMEISPFAVRPEDIDDVTGMFPDPKYAERVAA